MSVTLKMEKLGPRARGNFGPKKDGPIEPRVIDALKGSTFLVKTPQWLIGGCSDERRDIFGQRLLLSSAFGGFFNLVIADALTVRKWYKPGMTVQEHAQAMQEGLSLKFPHAKICVHTDEEHENGTKCGCAAIAEAEAVVRLLIRNDDLVDSRYRALIVANAQELLATGYFQPKTKKLVESLDAAGAVKEVLRGEHEAKFIVVNDLSGYVYDRPKLYAHFEEELELPIPYFFAYDRWSLKRTAKEIVASDERDFFFAGGDAFNKIVPLAICTPHTTVLTIVG